MVLTDLQLWHLSTPQEADELGDDVLLDDLINGRVALCRVCKHTAQCHLLAHEDTCCVYTAAASCSAQLMCFA